MTHNWVVVWPLLDIAREINLISREERVHIHIRYGGQIIDVERRQKWSCSGNEHLYPIYNIVGVAKDTIQVQVHVRLQVEFRNV